MGVSTVSALFGLFGHEIVRADPSGAVAKVVEGLERRAALRAIPQEGLPDIPNLKHQAWRHQRAAYAFARRLPGALLNMGMGTGKSLTTIGIIMERGTRHVILCPKAVVGVWPWEFEKHWAGGPVILAPLDADGTERKAKQAEKFMRDHFVTDRPVVFVCNYESAWLGAMASFFMGAGGWDNLVLDEVHKIKAYNGKASKFCELLARVSLHRLGLTGTPLPHSPLDAFGIFRGLDRTIFGMSYTKFKNRYAVMVNCGAFNKVTAYQNMDEFQRKFDSITFTVGREVIDLPPEQHIPLFCRLEPSARRLYDEIEDAMYAEIADAMATGQSFEITVANAMVKVLKLEQVTSGHIKEDSGEVLDVSKAKAELLADAMDDLPVDEPVVVFARFTRDLARVRKVCEAKGRSYGELSGRVNQLEGFKRGEFDVIGVNIKSGGVGVDLTRACYAFYYSTGHSLGDFMQSQARVSRPGQTRPVRFYYMQAEKTVDVKIYDAMQKKYDVVDYIVSGGRSSGKKLLPFSMGNSK